MYKVFINDSSLQFRSEPLEGSVLFQNSGQLQDIFLELERATESRHIILHHEKLEEAWESWKSLFEIIEAAGGVVLNPAREVLMIYRLEKWDLPKGKIESGEKPDTAALREVVEECGVPEPRLIKRLSNTYHTYRIAEKSVLKRTYWYEMQLDEAVSLTPQLEEDITKAMWCDAARLRENIRNTYGNIVELLQDYLR